MADEITINKEKFDILLRRMLKTRPLPNSEVKIKSLNRRRNLKKRPSTYTLRPMTWDTLISVLGKLLHLVSPRLVLFIFLISAGLFFLPYKVAEYIFVHDWVVYHRAWLGLSMVVSGFYLIPFGVSPIVERQIASWRSKHTVATAIENLATDEKNFIKRFYVPQRVGQIKVWKHEVGKLESDGIVRCVQGANLVNHMEVYCMTATASKYVNDHPEFLAELQRILN
jgi:hypothetical protein